MKTLSQLIQEAIEKLADLKCVNGAMYFGSYDNPCDCGYAGCINQATWEDNIKELQLFLKTELTNIIKQSFKNTRVEEKEVTFDPTQSIKSKPEDFARMRKNFASEGYNKALSDKHNKECEFLGK